MHTTSFDTLVIGAGQAGLAAGYFLARAGEGFAILDAGARPGESWRQRWDSLRLFTPARYSSLPGLPFPAAPAHLPHKDEVADYLDAYAAHFGLPVRPHTTVRAVRREGDGFAVHTEQGLLTARNVIVATGAFHTPAVPAFAAELDAALPQLHSSAYRNPGQLPAGPVLVVGAGNSGAQIALELAASRTVWLAGPDVGALPRRVLGQDLYWWIWRPLLSAPLESWRGRRLGAKLTASDPLIGIDLRKEAPSTLHRAGRVRGVDGGRPVLDGSVVPDVAAVVWCTGFRPDFGWIEPDVCDAGGAPRHVRGVVPGVPGLYFLGLRALSRRSSSLIGGVGVDAAYVVDHLTRRRQPREATPLHI